MTTTMITATATTIIIITTTTTVTTTAMTTTMPHQPLIPGADDCYVSPGELRGFFVAWVRRLSEGVGRVRSTTWLKPEFYREYLPPSRGNPLPRRARRSAT